LWLILINIITNAYWNNEKYYGTTCAQYGIVGVPITILFSVYHSLDGDYGLQTLDEICSDIRPLYGEVCLLGVFNVDLLDPGHSLFARFLDLLEMFML
jgi:hypothetical protein